MPEIRLERRPLQARYEEGRTVADMARGGWDVISKCETCGLMMRADLKLIAFVSGPRVSLWNRKARCRRLLCQGVVRFHARAPGMSAHEPLSIDERVRDDRPSWAERQIARARRKDGDQSLLNSARRTGSSCAPTQRESHEDAAVHG